MTTYQDIRLPTGQTWNMHLYSVTIPEGEISGLSEKTIGQYVRALVDLLPAWRVEYYGHRPGSYKRAAGMAAKGPTYQFLVQRDGERCQVPGCRDHNLHIDHIVPRYLGGSDDLSNLQLLCRHHNLSKGTSNWKDYLDQLWRSFERDHREQLAALQEWEAIGYRMEGAHE